MRSLLTGYAGAFNRRSQRTGHLFQNRYKSIVCDEETYFVELVRYLHLNPLRARLVTDLTGLAEYAYSGHGALVGRHAYTWQDTEAVLGQFGTTQRRAHHEYLRFMAEGLGQGRRPELQGGGLIRSAGGWAAVQELRRGREGYGGDERVLGSSEFVERIRQEVEAQAAPAQSSLQALSVEAVIERVCEAEEIWLEELTGAGRRAAVSRARAGVAYLWLERLGQPGSVAARALGLHPATIYAVARRGRPDAVYWESVFGEV